VKKIVKKFKKRKEAYEDKKRLENEPPSSVPRITNTTVADHRDEVLSSARKFIYPLQQSKHKIVLITTSILIATILAFFAYCTIALYRLQSTSTFLYKVTQIIPFPVARVGRDFIAYENYLFELRRYMHYYETQQKLDFNTESGKQQLAEYKKRALEKVIDYAYIKELAKTNNVSVSNAEIDAQIELLRSQNRLGNGDEVFDDVLRDYFGWSRDDFRRYLSQELLAQKLVAALDTETTERANRAYAELQAGKTFEAVAKKYSDDLASKDNGGEYGFQISQTSRDITPQATETLFTLKKGEYSEIVNTGYSLEIFKLVDRQEDRVKGAHILFNFKKIDSYTNDVKEAKPSRAYISAPSSSN